MLQAVLFDFEGTLVDFQWRLADAEAELRAVLQELGFDLSPFEKDNYAVLRTRALDLAASPEVAGEVERRFGAIYDRYDFDALSRWNLQDGAADLLTRLRASGKRLALVSNVGRLAIDRVLERFGLTGAFDAVVTRNEVSRAKPSGEGLRKALSLLRTQPADAFFVGDSLSDILAARDAEMKVAILLGGENPAGQLRSAQPDWILESLREAWPLATAFDAGSPS